MKAGPMGRMVLVVTTVAMLGACSSDARLKKVVAGISKDSVTVLTGGAVPHHVETYLTGGKLWEVQFYAPASAAPGDSTSVRSMSPVVYADGMVTGKGWSYWESEAKTLSIPVPPKD